jgi:hypothetical protein
LQFVGKEVKSGEIDIKLKDGFLPFVQKVDLCNTMKQAGGSCPLEPGKQTISLSLPIPSMAPKVSSAIDLAICHSDNIISER